MRPLRSTKDVSRRRKLTADEGKGLELVFPFLCELDGLHKVRLTCSGIPLFVGVSDEGLRVVGVNRVQDVEHVGAVTHLALGKRVGHEGHELHVLGQLGPEIFDAKLVIMRHIDPLDVVFSEQSFLASKHGLKEIFSDGALRRQVQLH